MRRGLGGQKGVGVTRCGADKGLQGPCITVLSFVPQPRGRQLVGSQRVQLRPPAPTSHICLAPTLAPRPPAPLRPASAAVRGCRTEELTSVIRDLAKETY